MSLKIGDQVFVLDEDWKGIILSLDKEFILVESEDGFEYQLQKNPVYKLTADSEIEFERTVFKVEQEIHSSTPRLELPNITFKGKKAVFDLHLESLVPNIEFSNQHEALLFQLNFVKEVLHKASRKRHRRIIFVHGIGKGRLRDELRKMLSESYPQVEYFDGSYLEFGHGATEIVLHHFFEIE